MNMITTSKQCLQIHVEAMNMMEGLDEVEEHHYFNDNPKIIPLFEVDILQALTSYVDRTWIHRRVYHWMSKQ